VSGIAGRAEGPEGNPPLIVRDQPGLILRRRAGGRDDERDPVRSIAHILRATFILGGICLTLWVLSGAVITLMLAVILAVLLRGLGRWFSRHTGIGATASVLLVFLALVVAIFGLGYWAGPRFVSEGEQLWTRLSGGLGYLSNLFGYHDLNGLSGAAGNAAGDPRGVSGSAAKLVTGHATMITGLLRLVASSFVGLLAAILVIVATGVYLAISPDIYVNGVSHLTPVWYQDRTREILRQMGEAMQGWMLGQLIDMVIVGVIVGVGLGLSGTPLSYVLGIIAGVLTFIPYFGTIISAVPALIVALTVGLEQVIIVIGVFLVAHAVEGYLVSPFVQRRTVHLPPALTLVSFVVMVAIFNIFGVLIATPLMACIMVGVTRIYVEDILGDPAGKHLHVKSRWYWFTPPDEA
jgi:predicted PurR-regulated permease PerM